MLAACCNPAFHWSGTPMCAASRAPSAAPRCAFSPETQHTCLATVGNLRTIPHCTKSHYLPGNYHVNHF